MNKCVHQILALLLLPVSVARADAPLAPPQKTVACSLSGVICAESDPAANVTSIIRKQSAEVLWSIEGWHRWLFVSNDGSSIAVAYDGMNLVPVESNLELEVVHFYKQGKLIRTIRLADLYCTKSQLIRTASHFAWVNSVHINHANQLVLELVSGQIVAFDMSSGASSTEVRNGA